MVLLFLLALVAPQDQTVVLGQPRVIEASHDGVNTVAYRLYENGAVVAEEPVSKLMSGLIHIPHTFTTPGARVIWVTTVGPEGKTAKSHEVNVNVIDKTQLAVMVPKNLRLRFPDGLMLPPPLPPTARVNVALASSGATVTASSGLVNAPRAVNGDRKDHGWIANTTLAIPSWIEVSFAPATISTINVISLQDANLKSGEPTEEMVFNPKFYGLTHFSVQAWVNGAWVEVGRAENNNLVIRSFTIEPILTDKIRVTVGGAATRYLSELEVFTAGAR